MLMINDDDDDADSGDDVDDDDDYGDGNGSDDPLLRMSVCPVACLRSRALVSQVQALRANSFSG